MSTFYEGPGAPKKLEKGCILGIGNPLLDIMANVPESLLKKYDLKMNNAILAEEKHAEIYSELVNDYDFEYVAGGATQNAIRVAQWLSQSEGATTFLGSIGKDDFGEQLKAACAKAGVNPIYHVSEENPTGLCACVVYEKERTMVTRLDACNDYKTSHTVSAPVQEAIQQAKVFYMASFFLTVPNAMESVMEITKNAAENNKIFAMNLSAEFLIEFFRDQMEQTLPYADFVFGNESEGLKFGEVHGFGTDLEEIAIKISALPKKSGARPRVVVISQGGDPTIVACNGKVTKYPVPALKSELLVDTNGAGDAFVGGFLARLAAGFPMEECVRSGHYAARVVIQRGGCTVPDQPDI